MPKGWLWLLSAALLQTAAHGNEVLISLTNQVWRYSQSGADAGWQDPAFDDSAWPEGRGLFAYETTAGNSALSNNVYPYTNTVLFAAIDAPDRPNHIVDYFRTHFTFSGNSAYAVLTFSNLVDDGYIAYINGIAVDVFNMNPSGTLAALPIGQGAEGTYVVRSVCPPEGTLQQGDNVLAVAVYQNAGTSSDVVWGTVLHASPVIIPQIVFPTNTVYISVLERSSTNLTVSAGVVLCGEYQWFFEGSPIQGATSPTYTIANMDSLKDGTYYATVTTRAGSSRSADFVVSLVVVDPVPPRIQSAIADPADLSLVRVIFSTDVTDGFNPPLDPLQFYIEDRNNPQNAIGVTSATYGPSSNIVILTLWQPRDPTIRYELWIVNHNIQDFFGNRLVDPATAHITIPKTFQNGVAGYMGTQDTEVRFSAPDSANGGQATTVNTDTEDGLPLGPVHSLLRFDNFIGGNPGQVPRGMIIFNATLRLYTDDPSFPSTPVRMLRMMTTWNEQSTWNSLGNGIDQTNGLEAGITDALIVADQDNTFIEIDVTAAVQAWVNGQTNYGWAFLPTGPNGWRWASSENATVAQRPSLAVVHDPGETWCFILDDPDDVMVEAESPFTLSILAGGSDLQYQWYFDPAGGPVIFSPIAGATNESYAVASSRLTNTGSYYAVVRGPDSFCTSRTAYVTVLCHGFSPHLLSAIGNADQSTITLLFDDTLDKASAQNVANYAISGGLTVVTATNNGTQVTLTTSPQREVGRNYTLTVQNLMDDSLCTNRIYPNPTILNLTQDVRILSFDSIWRYHNEGHDLGTAWRDPFYDDTTWPSGLALLGFEDTQSTLTTLSNQNLFVRTTLTRSNAGIGRTNITDYFRTWVNFPFYTAGFPHFIRHVVDDGAIFYFNGAEVARFNMPTGGVNFATPSIMGANEGIVRTNTALSGLTCGMNSISVEVHNQSTTSGDVLFGAEIIARMPYFAVPVCDGSVRIVHNTDGSVTLSWQPLGVLQQSDVLGGEWINTPNQTNPMRIQPTAPSRFYRLSR